MICFAFSTSTTSERECLLSLKERGKSNFIAKVIIWRIRRQRKYFIFVSLARLIQLVYFLGADVVILERLRPGQEDIIAQTQDHLDVTIDKLFIQIKYILPK